MFGNRNGHRERRRRMSLRHRPLVGLAVSALVLFAACGDDSVVSGNTPLATSAGTSAVTTPTVPSPQVLLRYVTSGGCEMAGPNCPTYTVWSDGTVEASRTPMAASAEPAPAEVSGNLPAETVQQWYASVQTLDVDALAAAVGPGSCASCVDGVDVVATINLPSGAVVLDSTKLAFDEANPTFAALEDLIAQVRAVVELPMQMRG